MNGPSVADEMAWLEEIAEPLTTREVILAKRSFSAGWKAGQLHWPPCQKCGDPSTDAARDLESGAIRWMCAAHFGYTLKLWVDAEVRKVMEAAR